MASFRAVYGDEPRPREVSVSFDNGMTLRAGSMVIRDFDAFLAARAILDTAPAKQGSRARRLLQEIVKAGL